MGTHLNPYITFNGDARQAMEFYAQVFGGELKTNTFGDFGGADAATADKIMHAQLEAEDGLTLMASDPGPGMQYTPGGNMAISLSGDDDAKLHGYWDKLSDGGTVAVPLEKQMWGDVFGMCVDKFGITWMVNIVQPQAS
jgi:PhnB protein